MAIVISGPDDSDPSYLQGQIDENASAIALLEARPYSITKAVSAPTDLVQITHGLGFVPAGVTCIDTQGDIVEPASVAYPTPGVTEVGFGFSFTGTIYLS
jgi:hypothetical protein